MIYSLFADFVMLIHFGYILFSVLGALFLARWPRLIWLHLPTAAWTIAIEFYPGEITITVKIILSLAVLIINFVCITGSSNDAISVDQYNVKKTIQTTAVINFPAGSSLLQSIPQHI